MQCNLKDNNANIDSNSRADLKSSILDLIKLQSDNTEAKVEDEKRFVIAKNKLIKQLPNVYKNTRLNRFTIQENPLQSKLEYKRVKGLVLNIQKRMCWYLNIEPESTKCLLISVKARTAKEDLVFDDRNQYFFDYYCKFIFANNAEKKFIAIPLIDLNVVVI